MDAYRLLHLVDAFVGSGTPLNHHKVEYVQERPYVRHVERIQVLDIVNQRKRATSRRGAKTNADEAAPGGWLTSAGDRSSQMRATDTFGLRNPEPRRQRRHRPESQLVLNHHRRIPRAIAAGLDCLTSVSPSGRLVLKLEG